VLHHLEAQLINVACDDPGAAIGAQLALPLLQERLDAKAQDFARQKAAQAEEDIIKMEVSQVGNACCVRARLATNRLSAQCIHHRSITQMCNIREPHQHFITTHRAKANFIGWLAYGACLSLLSLKKAKHKYSQGNHVSPGQGQCTRAYHWLAC